MNDKVHNLRIKKEDDTLNINLKFLVSFILGFSIYSFGQIAIAADPPVKKSVNNICHDKSSRSYKRTKNFKVYNTMKDCLKSGGRKPKK